MDPTIADLIEQVTQNIHSIDGYLQNNKAALSRLFVQLNQLDPRTVPAYDVMKLVEATLKKLPPAVYSNPRGNPVENVVVEPLSASALLTGARFATKAEYSSDDTAKYIHAALKTSGEFTAAEHLLFAKLVKAQLDINSIVPDLDSTDALRRFELAKALYESNKYSRGLEDWKTTQHPGFALVCAATAEAAGKEPTEIAKWVAYMNRAWDESRDQRRPQAREGYDLFTSVNERYISPERFLNSSKGLSTRAKFFHDVAVHAATSTSLPDHLLARTFLTAALRAKQLKSIPDSQRAAYLLNARQHFSSLTLTENAKLESEIKATLFPTLTIAPDDLPWSDDPNVQIDPAKWQEIYDMGCITDRLSDVPNGYGAFGQLAAAATAEVVGDTVEGDVDTAKRLGKKSDKVAYHLLRALRSRDHIIAGDRWLLDKLEARYLTPAPLELDPDAKDQNQFRYDVAEALVKSTKSDDPIHSRARLVCASFSPAIADNTPGDTAEQLIELDQMHDRLDPDSLQAFQALYARCVTGPLLLDPQNAREGELDNALLVAEVVAFSADFDPRLKLRAAVAAVDFSIALESSPEQIAYSVRVVNDVYQKYPDLTDEHQRNRFGKATQTLLAPLDFDKTVPQQQAQRKIEIADALSQSMDNCALSARALLCKASHAASAEHSYQQQAQAIVDAYQAVQKYPQVDSTGLIDKLWGAAFPTEVTAENLEKAAPMAEVLKAHKLDALARAQRKAIQRGAGRTLKTCAATSKQLGLAKEDSLALVSLQSHLAGVIKEQTLALTARESTVNPAEREIELPTQE